MSAPTNAPPKKKPTFREAPPEAPAVKDRQLLAQMSANVASGLSTSTKYQRQSGIDKDGVARDSLEVARKMLALIDGVVSSEDDL